MSCHQCLDAVLGLTSNLGFVDEILAEVKHVCSEREGEGRGCKECCVHT